MGRQIAFPVDDALFAAHPHLPRHALLPAAHRPATLHPLSPHFPHELQLWNMVVEHPAFFELSEDLTLDQLSAMVRPPPRSCAATRRNSGRSSRPCTAST